MRFNPLRWKCPQLISTSTGMECPLSNCRQADTAASIQALFTYAAEQSSHGRLLDLSANADECLRF